jgi:hypothetical protein
MAAQNLKFEKFDKLSLPLTTPVSDLAKKNRLFRAEVITKLINMSLEFI